jgi:hypothetical protein
MIYEYKAWGSDADDLVNDARVKATAFFGDWADLRFDVERVTNLETRADGTAVYYAGECRAWRAP